MDWKSIIFTVAGGLALFLYGMTLLSQGLQMAFADRLKQILEKLTDNKFKGVGIGIVTTSIIQSSSVTTVTLVGLINAGIITLQQTIPVIFGANIGTTVTAQMIAFKLEHYCLPILAVGFFMYMMAKSDKWKYTGQIIMGFGILFFGLSTMSSEVKKLAEDENIVYTLAHLGDTPWKGILASMLFTEIIQSSSATSGVVIKMANAGLINIRTAVCMIMGANIGTTITVVIAAFGGRATIAARRAALSHVLFNVSGIIIFYPLLGYYTDFISRSAGTIERQIANCHTFFNVTMTLIWLFLLPIMVKLVTTMVPGEDIKVDKGASHLDEHTLKTPPIAFGMAQKETLGMAKMVLAMVNSSRKALLDKNKVEIEMVKEQEKIVDTLDEDIEVFISKINTEVLSLHQRSQISLLNHAISDLERIADHANNICELADILITKKLSLSDDAWQELIQVFDITEDSVKDCITVIVEGNEEIINKILNIEREVDKLVRQFEDNHLTRLEDGTCTPEAGPIYLDVLRNLERISDHTHNIAYAKRFGF